MCRAFSKSLFNLSDFALIDRFFFLDVQSIPSLKSISLSMVIRDLQDEKSFFYPRSVTFLENVTTRRAFVFFYKKYLKGRGLRQYCFFIKVNLERSNFLDFLFFSCYFVIPLLSSSNSFFNFRVFFLKNPWLKSKNFVFCFRDVTLFPGTLENFLKWSYPLFFSFLFSTFNFYYIYIIIRNLFFFSFSVKNLKN